MAPRPKSNEKRDAWMLNVMAHRAFEETHALCKRAGIPLLPVKGIVTAKLLYADTAERPLSDVDVRIRRSDLGTMRDAASAAGWVLLRDSKAYSNLVFARGMLSVDVETAVGPPGLSALTVEEMLERATKTRSLHGFEHLIPETHDHAVHLVVNAFKDKIVYAGHGAIEDLDRIVRLPDFAVETFVSRVESARIVTEAWVVADWFADRRSNDVWHSIHARLSERLPRPRYARLFRLLIRANDPTPLALQTLARLGADDASMRRTALVQMIRFVREEWKSQGKVFDISRFRTNPANRQHREG